MNIEDMPVDRPLDPRVYEKNKSTKWGWVTFAVLWVAGAVTTYTQAWDNTAVSFLIWVIVPFLVSTTLSTIDIVDRPAPVMSDAAKRTYIGWVASLFAGLGTLASMKTGVLGFHAGTIVSGVFYAAGYALAVVTGIQMRDEGLLLWEQKRSAYLDANTNGPATYTVPDS